ncbi:hypothetical protein GCM10007148_23980 [Parvularcula lutaonensis]|nr:hypothetical protein GCM10007148_23980 [Parvularcula lutaonensis]
MNWRAIAGRSFGERCREKRAAVNARRPPVQADWAGLSALKSMHDTDMANVRRLTDRGGTITLKAILGGLAAAAAVLEAAKPHC